jgi:predicted PurR-regulated permease PerM
MTHAVRASRALWLLTILATVAALYFAKAIFIPLALAVLLTFVLAPPARLLRQWGVRRVPAALIVVVLAFLSILGLGLLLGQQLNDLATELPKYEYTITGKIENVRDAVANGGMLQSMSQLLNHVNQEILPKDASSVSKPEQPQPMPVQLVEPPPSPAVVIRRIIDPLLDPLTTSGLILLFVSFFLLERETLRERIIRLAGSHDLRRTTQLIDDGARRLSRYFLAQTLLNAFFGVVVAIGLALIGVPNAVLWGILGMLLRFVPYLGAWIAAAFPLVISFAVDPGWSKTVWTAGFFLLIEPLIGQVIEPVLYGHSTGVTPVAVIISATFWTWLWGPIGLLLSTPLAVCLGVLGRHVESLKFLEIMIGDEPPLSPAQTFYHRALSGSENEAIDQIEDALKAGKDLATCYQEILLEALVLAEIDRHRGVLDDDHAGKINGVMQSVLAELADQEEWPVVASVPGALSSSDRAASEPPKQQLGPTPAAPAAAVHRPVLVVSGPGQFDHTIALPLVQLLERSGMHPRLHSYTAIAPLHIAQLDATDVSIVYFSYLSLGYNPTYLRHSIRRLRRRLPSARIVACQWGSVEDAISAPDSAAYGADACVCAFTEAISYGREALLPVIADPSLKHDSIAKLIAPTLPDEALTTTSELVPAH